ncbi:MAG: hypothetical protein OXG44_11865 [Gammaproteobacteria bacterium]|nr:hypothetical protein [Gammaproteobacteria bacterium]
MEEGLTHVSDLDGNPLPPGGPDWGMNAVDDWTMESLAGDPEYASAVVAWCRQMRLALERAGGQRRLDARGFWQRADWWHSAVKDASSHLYDDQAMRALQAIPDSPDVFEGAHDLPQLPLGAVAQSLGMRLAGLTGMRNPMFDTKVDTVISRLSEVEDWLGAMVREALAG